MVMAVAINRVPPKVDRVGGIGSILTGLLCAYIGWGDKEVHHSIWRVWAFFCALLIFNGIAMLIHAQETVKLEKS
jgi:NAD(P)H-hydrate repair Nnr-like enzyme with NAD(P)H-hydrate dehydratase domain